MSCVSSATATEYTTVTSYTTSTSLSQSVGTNQGSVTTIVQQSCVATGTLSGSATGCVSSTAVTQVNTIAGGGTTAQVPVIVTVSVTETLPTNTLYATCSAAGSTQTQPSTTSQTSSSTTSSALSVTTSVLVETTPPPSIITQSSSTTLANGDVVPTTIIMTSTLPPSSIYVASTIANPSTSATSTRATQSGSGTNVAPIVGGVIGGFIGLILIVSALWYFCRRRTSWDDVFEGDDPHDEESDYPIAVRRERDRNRLDLGSEPKPYQYGLVGHVTPPPGSGSTPSTHEPSAFHHPSFTASSHSRNTSITPLLGAVSAPGKATRPSTAGSMQAAAQPTQRQPSASATSQSSTDPRTVSMVSNSSSAPLIDDSTNRAGSPISVVDRRVLQIINDAPLSPVSIMAPASPVPASPAPAPSAPARSRKGASAPRPSTGVVQHIDAGQVSSLGDTSNEPPPYSRV